MCTVLTQLGERCEFIGPLSNNTMFRFLIEDCANRGILIPNCVFNDNLQGAMSSIFLSEETGSRTIVNINNMPHINYEDFGKIDLNLYKWIHFEVIRDSM